MRKSWDMGRRGWQGRPGPLKPRVQFELHACATGSSGTGAGRREETDLTIILQRAAWQLWEDPPQGRREAGRQPQPLPCPRPAGASVPAQLSNAPPPSGGAGAPSSGPLGKDAA